MAHVIQGAPHRGVSKAENSTLRANFKQLSSGIKAQVSDTTKVESDIRIRNDKSAAGKFTALIKDLNDAVSFSSMALESLDKIALTTKEDESNPEVVTEFSEDLSRLKASIGDTLGMLKSRMSTAEVIRENLISSESKIRDVDEATRHAQTTTADISQNTTRAIETHARLTIENVLRLLEE